MVQDIHPQGTATKVIAMVVLIPIDLGEKYELLECYCIFEINILL